MVKHIGLIVVIGIYLALAITHSVTVPLTTGNDEWAHFQYLRFISETGHLPRTFAERDAAGYKADAPPLYHLIIAAATSWMEPTRLIRPLDSPRRHLADTDSYAVVHTAVELWPYRGEVLLWHLGRGFSIVFGVGVIIVTYVTALMLRLSRPQATLAAATVAFIPAFVFHSSVLTYESLSALVSGLFLLVGLRAIAQPTRRRWWILLGLLAGVSMTIKYSAVLLPLEIAFIAWLATRNLSRWFRQLMVPALAFLLAISWWFGFLLWNFNTVEHHGPIMGLIQPVIVGDASDTTSVQVASLLFGESIEAEARPRLERNYPELLSLVVSSFWAAPVGDTFRWWQTGLAVVITVLTLLGLAGLTHVWRQGDATTRTQLILLLFHALLIIPLLLVRTQFSYDARETAQGRHLLMPAATVIPILLVWGWSVWRFNLTRWTIVGLLLWSAAGQVGWASLNYAPPLSVWPNGDFAPTPPHPLDVKLNDSIRLAGYDVSPTDEAVEVTLWWEALAINREDYLVELNLLDESGGLVGFSVAHPLNGRYISRAWEPGDIIKDTHRLTLLDTRRGNHRLEVNLLTRDAAPHGESQVIDVLSPPLEPPDIPTPLEANFNDEIKLLGYDLPTRRIYPGGRLPVTLYWQGLAYMGADYTMFDNLLDAEQIRRGGYDRRAQDGYSTLRWIPGEVVEDAFGVPVDPDAPPGVYTLDIGWYETVDGQPVSLPVLSADGSPTGANSIRIGPIKVGGPPPGVTAEHPTPETRLDHALSPEITLLGYTSHRDDTAWHLTLYWQATGIPRADYTTFVHLRDFDNNTVAQQDGPPALGQYPSSLWDAGEIIVDEIVLPIGDVSPGSYTPVVGLYDPVSGARLGAAPGEIRLDMVTLP